MFPFCSSFLTIVLTLFLFPWAPFFLYYYCYNIFFPSPISFFPFHFPSFSSLPLFFLYVFSFLLIRVPGLFPPALLFPSCLLWSFFSFTKIFSKYSQSGNISLFSSLNWFFHIPLCLAGFFGFFLNLLSTSFFLSPLPYSPPFLSLPPLLFYFHTYIFCTFFPSKKYFKNTHSSPATNCRHTLGPESHFSSLPPPTPVDRKQLTCCPCTCNFPSLQGEGHTLQPPVFSRTQQ